MVRFAQVLLPLALTAAPVAAQELAPPSTVDEAMPQPPATVAATFATPPRDAAGRYLTPNRDLSEGEAVWHLRVALNVAALGCRGADEGATVAAYNALLASARSPLADARVAMAGVYRTRYGTAAQAKADDAMTRLYNFFAQPTGHEDFCAAAKGVLTEVATVEPSTLAPYAAATLPRLEAPFLAFFAAWDAYRVSLAQWQGRHPAPGAVPPVTFATAAPVPMPAVAQAAPVAVVQVAEAAPPAPPVLAAAASPSTPAPVLTAAVSAPGTGTSAPVTITLSAEALRAIVAGQVPGVTIAGSTVVTAATPAPAVVVASLH